MTDLFHSSRTRALVNALISLLSFAAACALRFAVLDGRVSYGLRQYALTALFFAFLHLLVYRSLLHTSLGESRSFSKRIRLIVINESICLFLILSLLFVLSLDHISRLVLLIAWLLGVLMCIAWEALVSAFLSVLRKKGDHWHIILLVGQGKTAVRYAQTILSHPETGCRLAGVVCVDPFPLSVPHLGDYASLESIVAQLQPAEAVVALPADHYIYLDAIISVLEQAGVPLHIVPCYEERIGSRIVPSVFEDIQMIGLRDIPLSRPHNALIKRLFDIVLSLLLILLLSPLMLLTAVGVKLSTHESVFFIQKRIGKDKRPFYMYKFRSMLPNEREDTAWSCQQDERRTLFGAIIRKFSIDELPQLFNVLRGDMSLVGPRPELPLFVEQFRDEIPLYMLRHMVKPGITGLAQVKGFRGDTSIKRRIEFDISYIENWSVWLDFRILLSTIPALINNEKLPDPKTKNGKKP